MLIRITAYQEYILMISKTTQKLVRVPDKLACQVQERLLVVVVTLGRYLMILKILLSVKCDLLWLHLPVFDINLVPT